MTTQEKVTADCLSYEIGHDPATGKRRTQFETVRGTKRGAQALLSKRLTEVAEGEFVARTRTTVADYARHWLRAIAPIRASAKTRERYEEIIEKTIIPHLGDLSLQKLDGTNIDAFYLHLHAAGRRDGKGGLSPQTVQHVHRLLSQILASAVKAKKLRQSPMQTVQKTPRVRRADIQVLDDTELKMLFAHLKGRPMYMPVMLAAATAMRRGEVLAVRWRDLDLDNGTLRVAQVVEQTKTGVSIKEPKTERSRRTITLPPRLVQELGAHRKEQAALRLKLGLGKNELDLLFPTWKGGLQQPRDFTKSFAREAVAARLPHITFHGLRHTHITHLLRAGVPVHVVSARAGHANPSVTLNIYAHLLPGQQEGAAAIFDVMLRTALTE